MRNPTFPEDCPHASISHHRLEDHGPLAAAALSRLQGALEKLCARPGVLEDFECFEREAHALFTQAEREVLGEQLERLDVDVPTVVIGGWTYLSAAFPQGAELVDFFHAAEQLKAAFDAAHGENSPQARAQFEKYRHLLRWEPNGVSKVIRALVHLHGKYPRRKRLTQVLGYFRKHRHRMGYAETAAKNLPIGSGVVEAACKTLATQRMKRSGMRWRHAGGQAILTLRGLMQSKRFDQAWQLLSNAYHAEVMPPDNVVPLSSHRRQ